jgi:hypothetical protein
MFKAKFIEDKRYFDIVHSQSVLFVARQLLPVFLIAFPIICTIILWGVKLIIPGLILMFALQQVGSWLTLNYARKRTQLAGENMIQMDEGHFYIKSRQHQMLECIDLNKDTKIILPQVLEIPNHYSWASAIKGIKKNLISISHNHHNHTYFFEFESYYMIEQLKKLMDQWEKNGIQIERV